MKLFRLVLPLLVALTCGLLGVAIHFVPHPSAGELKKTLAQWSIVIGGFAVLLGVYSLTRIHVEKIRRRGPGWGYSIFFFVGFLGMSVAGLYNGGQWFWHDAVGGAQFRWVYRYVFTAAGATMFSVLGFFIASAAYRTFRARTFLAGILLSAAIVVMLGRAPLGELITPYIPAMAEWIMMVPNIAAKRAILFGVCLGGIATALKIMFGIERTYLGGGD